MAKKENKQSEKSDVKKLEIPRYALSLLYTILNVPIHGAQLRARNTFGKMIRTEMGRLEDIRIEMVEKQADKDPKTKQPLKTKDGSEYQIKPENLEKYQKEFDKLMRSNFEIELDQETKQSVTMLRPLVLESKLPLSTVDGYTYEELCKAFEAI